MATICITNLRLRTVIGTYEWERDVKQDVVINAAIDFDATKVCQSDAIEDTVDYKDITKQIIKEVEGSSFQMIEKLAKMILDIIMNNPKVDAAQVRVDKPFALRFADSVSIELSDKRAS